MYNFAQALSAGYVKLIDWKSIENAQMATVEFKNELIKTALECGTLEETADGMYKTLTTNARGATFELPIDATHNFNDSLMYQWMTTDVLVKTLNRYADATTDIGKKATEAATEVKTFTMLMYTLKEAVQSGWGYTWEYIIGDFDEAKKLWTEVAKAIGGVLDRSSEARNAVLKEWHDLGGRDELIQIFRNLAASISSIVKPIKEAFREIFPKKTGQDLLNITKSIQEFTAKLKLSDEAAQQVKSTFKGLFAFLKIVITVLKTFANAAFQLLEVFKGVASGVLGLSGSFGEWITKIKDTVINSNTLADVLNHIVVAIGNIISQIGKFAKETLKFDKIVNFFKGVLAFIGEIAKALGNMIQEALRQGDIKAAIDVLNGGLFGALLLNFKKFINNLTVFSDNLKGTLGALKGILVEYQKEIKANTLMTIAKAIAILAASLFVLALIDPDKLAGAISAMALVITELMGALWAFNKVTKNLKGSLNGSMVMISLALSILGMADALKKISSIEPDRLLSSLDAMIIGIASLVIAIRALPENDTRKAASAIGKLSFALLIYSVAMKILSSIPWVNLVTGTWAAAAALTMLVIAINALPSKGNFGKGAAMIETALSLVILAGALKILATMSWDDIGRSLAAMGGALLELTLALKFIPKGSVFSAAGLLVATFSLIVLGGALKILATMSWDDIGRSMVAMGGALLALILATKFMSVKGSAAMLVTATSLIILAGAMKLLGSMNLESIGIALIAMAGAFTVLGVAGLLLSKIAMPLMMAAAAMALFGVGAVLFGKGLLLVAAGIGALAAALASGTTAIVGAIVGIILGVLEAIPQIIEVIGKMILAFCDAIVKCAPAIAKTVLTVIYEILNSLADFAPMIISELARFIINILKGLGEHIPDILVAFMEFLGKVFEGAMKALSQIDPDVLLKGVTSLGILVVVMHLLASLVTLTPMAALGVIAFGVLVTELAGVIALVGNLSKIDGFQELITNGGNILQLIGTAIGQFIGGLVGGFSLGVSTMLPLIATNLSEFMENIKPFINGVKDIDTGIIVKIASLSGAILLLSAANLVSGIMQLLTLGRSLGDLGKQLSDFMNNSKDFIYGASSISPAIAERVAALSSAILMLTSANLLNNISNLFSVFTGGKSLSTFGHEIGSLGTSIREFANNLGTFDDSQVKSIKCGTDAIISLAQAADEIPKHGGIAQAFSGDNDLSEFGPKLGPTGSAIANFVKELTKDGTFDQSKIDIVKAGCEALKNIAQAAGELPKHGGIAQLFSGDNDLSEFGSKLGPAGNAISNFAKELTKDGTFDQSKIDIVKAGCEALIDIAQAAGELPKHGGIAQAFSGDNDISTFAGKLGKVAEGIRGFVWELQKDNVITEDSIDKIYAVNNIMWAIAGLGKINLGDTSGKLEELGARLGSFGNKITEYVKGINTISLDDLQSSKDKIDAIIEIANTLASVSSEPIEQLGEKLKNFATDALKKFVDGLNDTQPRDDATNSIKAFIDAIIKGMEEKKPDVEKGSKAVVETAMTTLKSYDMSGAEEVGKNFVQGFANGITNNIYLAIDAGSQVGKKALEAAKQSIDSHSPSKATYKLGTFFDQGFINGIKSLEDKIYSETYSVGDKARLGLGKAIRSVSNLISEGIDDEFTIRPVLDLSDVQSGAAAINSMIGVPSIGVAANLNAISSGMLHYRQNSGDEVVSAIDRLGKNLDNINGDIYNINGISYNDNTEISEAVQTLVRAARIERRT